MTEGLCDRVGLAAAPPPYRYADKCEMSGRRTRHNSEIAAAVVILPLGNISHANVSRILCYIGPVKDMSAHWS